MGHTQIRTGGRFAVIGLAAGLLLSACASYVDMPNDDSESLLSYVDFSKVPKGAYEEETGFDAIRRECAVRASAIDTTVGLDEMGIAAGVSTAVVGAVAAGSVVVAAPVAIAAWLLGTAGSVGVMGMAGQSNAPRVKTDALVNCLKDKGYDVDIRKK